MRELRPLQFGVLPSISSMTGINALQASRVRVDDAALLAPEYSKCLNLARDVRLAWRAVYASRSGGVVVSNAIIDACSGELLRRQERARMNHPASALHLNGRGIPALPPIFAAVSIPD